MTLLARRYRNDGRALLSLNPLQQSVRDVVEEKVRRGEYQRETARCAVCDSSESIPLAEKDRYGLSFHVVICSSCGLIYTNPRMTRAAYASFYDREYRPLYHGKTSTAGELSVSQVARAKNIVAFLHAHEVRLNGLRVLEVGCGAGGTLAYLRDTFGCRVTGCDFGSEGIAYASKQHGLDLHVGDLESIVLSWDPDLIIYSHVMEHVLDLTRECRLIRRVLSDTGLLYIEVPSVKNIRFSYEWDFLRVLQNAHVYHFTLATLTNAMRRHGFRLVHGTEFVRALFAKGAASEERVNDFEPVMQFLRRTERLRPFVRFGINARRLPRRLAVSLVTALGLKPMLKRAMGRV